MSSSFSDPDSDTLTYTVSSSDTAIATASVSEATVTITAVAAGSATITVTATDPDGLTAEQPIAVTVTQPNRAPTTVGTIADQTANIGQSDPTVDVSSYFSDPDSDTLTYSATSDDTAIATVSVSGATVTITPVAVGTATITVTATDPDGLTANQTFSVTTNNAPTAVGTIPESNIADKRSFYRFYPYRSWPLLQRCRWGCADLQRALPALEKRRLCGLQNRVGHPHPQPGKQWALRHNNGNRKGDRYRRGNCRSVLLRYSEQTAKNSGHNPQSELDQESGREYCHG